MSYEEEIRSIVTDEIRKLLCPEVKVLFADDEARKFGLPKYAKPGDAGADLFTILHPNDREHGLRIFPGTRELLDTGIHLELPVGVFARITHRSSTEKRYRLRIVEGTIDELFKGRLFVQVSNDTSYAIDIQHGQRLAQLVLSIRLNGQFSETTELIKTDRWQSGFGSSGV